LLSGPHRSEQSKAIDAYLATLPDDRRTALETIRRTVGTAAPGANEVIAYRMPSLRVNGRLIVSYDAFKRHYSLFPASAAVVEALGDELRPYLAGKGTIRFPADQPLPLELIARVVRIRVGECERRDGG
jgi:uncharacterized protein YdhG (YjbR/CyaY superfamily)